MPNQRNILDTITRALWNMMEEGCRPPDWVLNLHWQCTKKFGGEYLKEVADFVARQHEFYEPKKAPRSRSRSAEPDEADDGEGGPKTESVQPEKPRAHERRRRRKRQRSPSVLSVVPPKKKQCHHRQPHHGHRGREPKPGREHRGNSKEEPPTRNRTQPRELPEIHGHSSCCNSPCPQRLLRSRAHSTEVHCHSPKEAHPTESQARSKPQNRSPRPEESYSSSYSSSQESRSLSTLRQGGTL